MATGGQIGGYYSKDKVQMSEMHYHRLYCLFWGSGAKYSLNLSEDRVEQNDIV